jgi:hypothetical protein
MGYYYSEYGSLTTRTQRRDYVVKSGSRFFFFEIVLHESKRIGIFYLSCNLLFSILLSVSFSTAIKSLPASHIMKGYKNCIIFCCNIIMIVLIPYCTTFVDTIMPSSFYFINISFEKLEFPLIPIHWRSIRERTFFSHDRGGSNFPYRRL